MTSAHQLAKMLLEGPDHQVVLGVDCAKDAIFAEHSHHPLESVQVETYDRDCGDKAVLLRQYVFDTKFGYL